MDAQPGVIHVAAAVLRNGQGKFLVSTRPRSKSRAGYFEFPGGKLEPDEEPLPALQRELEEELGIQLRKARPLIAYPYQYPEQTIFLDFWLCDAFDGVPQAREGQQLAWLDVPELKRSKLLPADHAVVRALQLPEILPITPEIGSQSGDLLAGLQRQFEFGYRLVQFRQREIAMQNAAALLGDAIGLASRYDAEIMANLPEIPARQAGSTGLHLTAARLRECKRRPQGFRYVSAAVHNAEELTLAESLALDFVLLGPVKATATHPGAKPLGWHRFRELVRSAAIPVYALGGLSADDLECSWQAGAQGVAGIRAFWPRD